MFGVKHLVLGWVLGLVAACAFAIPAHAATVKLVCIIESGTLTANDNHKDGLGWRVVGGDGHYTLTISAMCAGSEKGIPTTSSFEMTSEAKYINVVCPVPFIAKARSGPGQTSMVPGSFEYIAGGDPAKGEPYYSALALGLKYDVEFAGPPSGLWYWHNDSTTKPATIPKTMDALIPNDDPRWKDPNPPKEFVYAGQLNLAPKDMSGKGPPDPPEKVECAKTFDASGVIVFDS